MSTKHVNTRSHYVHSAGLRLHQCVNTELVFIQGVVRVRHEFDDYGNHRIVVGNKSSEWKTYRGITQLKFKDGWVAATTEYYAGELPNVFMYFK